jgi:multiple sugar transport system substrate-binding protein
MKSKKLVSVILGALIASSVLSGCAKKDPEVSTKPAETSKADQPLKPATLQVWHHWQSEQRKPTITAIFDEFNKKYAAQGVKAESVPVPFDEIGKKLTAAVAAGNPPNVAIQAIEEVGLKASRKASEDITDYLPKDIANKYYDNLFETVKVNGRIYALPYNTDTRLVFYNKQMFAEAGIKEFPKTWDEMLAVADKLDKKEGGKYTRLAFLPVIGNFGFDTIAYANGGGMFDNPMNPDKVLANRKENVEALDFMLKWVDRYGRDTVNAWKQSGSGANDPFISGKVAMFGNVCNYIATIKKYAPNMEYGAVALPKGPSGKNPGAAGGGFVVEVPRGAQNIRESVEFVKFMTDDWATTKWALEQADVMINKNANENQELKKAPAWQSVIDLMKFTTVTRRHPYAPDAGSAMGKATDNVLTVGNQKPKEALDQAQASIEKMVKENEALKK